MGVGLTSVETLPLPSLPWGLHVFVTRLKLILATSTIIPHVTLLIELMFIHSLNVALHRYSCNSDRAPFRGVIVLLAVFATSRPLHDALLFNDDVNKRRIQGHEFRNMVIALISA